MELARGLIIPIKADSVLAPEIIYGDEITGIYFQTDDDEFGRITFENLDAIKICRGEYLPFPDDWKEGQEFCWVYKVENSKWQKERYVYEKTHYGNSYEFGGNVDEMLTDFSHYVFSFHDQFVEAIARGFWFEQDRASLFRRELQEGHPLLHLPEDNVQKFVAHGLTCQARMNPKSQEELIQDAKYCSQKLIEFALELDGKASVSHSLVLSYRNGKLTSSLRGYFGDKLIEFGGLARLADVKQHIEQHMQEVFYRRKAMGK